MYSGLHVFARAPQSGQCIVVCMCLRELPRVDSV